MTHRSLALVFLASLWFAQPSFAQDEPAPASPSVENEIPPGEPEKPKAQAGPIEEPIAEGSIKDASEKRRPYTLSLMAYMPWWRGIAGGLKVGGEIPIVHNGFIPKVNDSFSLEPSFAFAYGRYTYSAVFADFNVLYLTPALSAIWSFYFSPKFRLYAAVSLGYTIVSVVDDDITGGYNYFYHDFAVGMFYDFAQHWSFRADVGYSGLRAGIAYLF